MHVAESARARGHHVRRLPQQHTQGPQPMEAAVVHKALRALAHVPAVATHTQKEKKEKSALLCCSLVLTRTQSSTLTLGLWLSTRPRSANAS